MIMIKYRPYKICQLILTVFITAFLCTSAFADLPYQIDEQTAHKLAALANDGSTKWIDVYDYEGDNSQMSPPFFSYDELGKYEGSAGFFAVNPWTGEVWALWGCHKISTPASLEIQARIKRRFTGEKSKQYERLSRLKPECVIDDSETQ
jgi:hypothetical protein